jgi:uncharacterized protein (TIGR02145 family)
MKISFPHLAVPAVLCLLGAFAFPRLQAQTVIGGAVADPSALLDMQSATRGFLPPRMTTAERSAIVNPATGLLIFNTTFSCLEMNTGTPAQPVWDCLSMANTVTAASDAPTGCINTPLTPINHLTTGATGIGAATGLPPGVSAAWAANTITISGTPEETGTFNYSIPLTGGKGSAAATGTISIFSVENTVSNASYTPTQCVNTLMPAITHATTGASGIGIPTGLPDGVSASWAFNTITISGTPTAIGTFNYSIPLRGGCGSVFATGTITLTSALTGCQVCGVGRILTFMCHNLGADESADPFTPSWRLNGHYYQWGRAAVAANGPTGSSSGEANDGAITGWNTTAAPNDSWTDGSKTANDPCPAGFRIPTKAQWDAVLNTDLNPTRSYPGTWFNSTTNYTSGLRIGAGTSGLFLPAAGNRFGGNGGLRSRGLSGVCWSSTYNGGNWYMGFGSGHAGTARFGPLYGYSVRCVAE